MSIYRDAALAGWDAGLSMLLIRQDGSKSPAGKWKRRQTNRCTRRALDRLYTRSRRTGVGFVTGHVSGGVQLFEFDCRQTYETFLVAAEYVGLGDLVQRIRAGYEEETPGGGIHWLLRCSEVGSNTKLASRPKTPEERKHPKDAVQVLIETREEGGFVVTAPSDGTVHPSGRAYRLLSGGFSTIATITPEERRALYTLAESFDQMPVKEHQPPAERRVAATGNRPGDDFAARTNWAEILEPAGWTFAHQHGDTGRWWRPGKGRGESISATTNHAGSGLFYPFSTSTDFEAGRGYGKFSVYAILNHNGDFKAAARELGRQGFGTAPSLASVEPIRLAPIPDASICPELAEENARLRARVAELEAELGALKAVLFEAQDYTPAERVAAAAYIEDLDQSQRRGRTDDEGYARTATTVVAQRIGMKRTNVAKHLSVVESSGAFERRKEMTRNLDQATGKLKPYTTVYAKLNGSKVDALRTFAQSKRAEPSGWGGTRPFVCPNHPTAGIEARTHVTYHCGDCGRHLNPDPGTAPAPMPEKMTQVGSPTVCTGADSVVVTQLGSSPAQKRRKDVPDGYGECVACGNLTTAGRELCRPCDAPLIDGAEPMWLTAICRAGGCGVPAFSRGWCKTHLADAIVRGGVA